MTRTALLRSLLFVPGNRVRLLEKAHTLPSDGVILDLEDAVPLAQKTTARAIVRDALESRAFEPEVIVRVNAFSVDMTEADLHETIIPGVDGICLPKAETPCEVERLASLIAALERERGLPDGGVWLVLLVETALGVLNAYQLAKASQRVRVICLGGEDLTRDLGAIRTREGRELDHARAQLVLAARAAGVLPIDTVYTDLVDSDGLLN